MPSEELMTLIVQTGHLTIEDMRRIPTDGLPDPNIPGFRNSSEINEFFDKHQDEIWDECREMADNYVGRDDNGNPKVWEWFGGIKGANNIQDFRQIGALLVLVVVEATCFDLTEDHDNNEGDDRQFAHIYDHAQSKEDFYDDASDYQDDEPKDLGDASNYDENLVRKIQDLLNG